MLLKCFTKLFIFLFFFNSVHIECVRGGQKAIDILLFFILFFFSGGGGGADLGNHNNNIYNMQILAFEDRSSVITF